MRLLIQNINFKKSSCLNCIAKKSKYTKYSIKLKYVNIIKNNIKNKIKLHKMKN